MSTDAVRPQGRGTINDDHAIGAIGEHMVIIDLLRQGYSAVLAPAGARYDVLVDVGSRVLRIQVKSVAKIKTHQKKYKSYLFRSRNDYKLGEFDLVALVATDISTVAYMLPQKFISQSALKLQAPNHPKSKWRKQTLNIDEFPFSHVLSQLSAA
jgi:hypothetical protein